MNFNQTIFLTGFPGFIAERLVKRLASRDTKFFLLVQKSFIEKATQAIGKIAAKIDVPIERVFDLARCIDLHTESMSDSKEKAVAGKTKGLINHWC